MKVGFISPISMLSKYCTTDIQYCLPSLFLQSREYKEFYKKQEQVILDCRKLGWKRQPEDFELVQRVIYELHPSYTIAPSYMFSSYKTLKVFEEFLDKVDLVDSEEVVCLEGTNIEEVLELKDKLKGNTFAIPSHLYNICNSSNMDWNGKYIFIENHKSCDEFYGKDGILVTSLPIRLGLEGRLLSNNIPTPPSLDFSIKNDPYPMIISNNLKETLKIYSGVRVNAGKV